MRLSHSHSTNCIFICALYSLLLTHSTLFPVSVANYTSSPFDESEIEIESTTKTENGVETEAVVLKLKKVNKCHLTNSKLYESDWSTHAPGPVFEPKTAHIEMENESLNSENSFSENRDYYSFQLQYQKLPCSGEEVVEYSVELDNLTSLIESDTFIFEKDAHNNLYWTSEGHFKISRHEDVIPDNYCIQNISDSRVTVRVCPNSKFYEKLGFVANCVGAFILFLIVVTHILLWKSSNVHAWTIGMYSLLSCFRLFNIAAIYVVEDFNNTPDLTDVRVCVFKGVLHNFAGCATITWMTILNYDVWSTLRSMSRSSSASKGKLRFTVYCLFGFGLPLVIMSIFYIIKALTSPFNGGLDSTNTGPFLCSVDASPTSGIVFLIMVSICIVLAILTVKTLYDIKKGTEIISNSSTLSRSQVKIVLKLFVLMGISLIIQMFLWHLLILIFHVTWYSAVDSAIIILSSISMFWIILCNKKIKTQLCQNYKCFKTVFGYLDSNMKKLGVSLSMKSTSSFHSTQSTQSASGRSTNSNSTDISTVNV